MKALSIKLLVACVVVFSAGATLAAVETVRNDLNNACDAFDEASDDFEAIGCSAPDGTSGNPNELVECFSSSQDVTSQLTEFSYILSGRTAEVVPETLSIVVYMTDLNAVVPDPFIGEQILMGDDLLPGLHTVVIDPPIDVPQTFCVGLRSLPEDDAFRLEKTTLENPDALDTTFIFAPSCGAGSFTELDAIGFPGNWCVTATVEGEGSSECGDGVVEGGEECDDGGESASCDADCTFAACGDGTLNVTAGEECDGGGETADCDSDCTAAVCGDATTNMTAGEECDDGGESATCDPDCTFAVCGDGFGNGTAGESCDPPGDPAGANGNACRADCTVCGDGITDAGEECDDGDSDDNDACRNDCTQGELLVVLESFTAEHGEDGVQIEWKTALEIDTVGFRLLRAREINDRDKTVGEEIALHAGILAAKGTEVQGAEYNFLDNFELEPGNYAYFLEDVDLFGKVTRHGPVFVEIPSDETPQRVAPVGRKATSRQR